MWELAHWLLLLRHRHKLLPQRSRSTTAGQGVGKIRIEQLARDATSLGGLSQPAALLPLAL